MAATGVAGLRVSPDAGHVCSAQGLFRGDHGDAAPNPAVRASLIARSRLSRACCVPPGLCSGAVGYPGGCSEVRPRTSRSRVRRRRRGQRRGGLCHVSARCAPRHRPSVHARVDYHANRPGFSPRPLRPLPDGAGRSPFAGPARRHCARARRRPPDRRGAHTARPHEGAASRPVPTLSPPAGRPRSRLAAPSSGKRLDNLLVVGRRRQVMRPSASGRRREPSDRPPRAVAGTCRSLRGGRRRGRSAAGRP